MRIRLSRHFKPLLCVDRQAIDVTGCAAIYFVSSNVMLRTSGQLPHPVQCALFAVVMTEAKAAPRASATDDASPR